MISLGFSVSLLLNSIGLVCLTIALNWSLFTVLMEILSIVVCVK